MNTSPPLLLLLGCIVFLSAQPHDSDAPTTLNPPKTVSFRDSLDSFFDISEYLNSKVGFLPVPIVITEPAVGYGGGLSLLYFHQRKASHDTSDITTAHFPSISFLSSFLTENLTWGIFGGHYGLWKGDRIRYLGAGGYLDLNVMLYGDPLTNLPSSSVSIPFRAQGGGILQEVQFRVAQTPFFLGGRYSFFAMDNTFSFSPAISDDTLSRSIRANEGILTLISAFDTRNNLLTPTKGVKVQDNFLLFSEYLGGDHSFFQNQFSFLGYYPFTSWLGSALRLEMFTSSEETPFYLKPHITLRGIPAMRYQGNRVLTAETEQTFQIHRRWFLLAFGGIAQAADSFEAFADSDIKYNAGGGFRYEVARKLGLKVGMDVARGPEQWSFYLQVGSAWF